LSYYDKSKSDELKAKFADLTKPTGADFASLVDYVDVALQALDSQSTTTTTVAPTTTTTTTAAK